MTRDALITLTFWALAACRSEADAQPHQAVLSRLDEIDARIDELEARLQPPPTADSDASPQPTGVPELATAPYDEKLPKKMRLLVGRDGVQLGRETLTDDVLSKRLEAAVRRHGDPTVTLRADADIAQARVEEVLTLVRRAGVRRLAIATASAGDGEADTGTGY